jgi:hypothetical protein
MLELMGLLERLMGFQVKSDNVLKWCDFQLSSSDEVG